MKTESEVARALFESYRWRMSANEAYLKLPTDDYLSFGIVRRIVCLENRFCATMEDVLDGITAASQKRTATGPLAYNSDH